MFAPIKNNLRISIIVKLKYYKIITYYK